MTPDIGASAPAPAGHAPREAVFAVTGMTCASCAAVIEKVVGRLPGVESVTVNLAMERMTVRFDPAEVDEPAIAEAVEKAGYGAIPLAAAPAVSAGAAAAGGDSTITLGLIGMTCSSCAS